MRPSRRGFLGVVGGAAAGGRAFAAQALEQLSNIGVGAASLGAGAPSPDSPIRNALMSGLSNAPVAQGQQGGVNLTLMARQEMLRFALNNKNARGELESIAFEIHRNIGRIDPDIAILRAISPMAKIAYQRQRLVRAEVSEAVLQDNAWARMNRAVMNLFKVSI